jgi:hypothetical protein
MPAPVPRYIDRRQIGTSMSTQSRIVVADLDELATAVGEQIAALMAEFRQPPSHTLKKYLTQEDLVLLTGWSRRQLAYRRSRGDIPYIKRGHTILYKAEDVERFLDEGYVDVRSRTDRQGGQQ